MAVPITAAGKVVSFGGLERRTTSFRVASVALRDIPTCFIRCQKSFCMTGAILLRGFPEDGLHVSRQAQHFGGVHVHLCGKRSTLGVYCCVLLANHIVGAASSGDNVQLAWRAWDIARASFWVAGAPFGADPSCVECHFARQAQYLGHSTLYTLHSALDTLHLHIPHSTPYTLHSALYTLHSTLYTFTLHTLRFTLHTLHSTLCTGHFALHNPHFIPYTLHSPLNTPLSSCSTLCTPPHSTLHSLHWHGNRGNVQRFWRILFHKSVLRDCIWVRWLLLFTVLYWLIPPFSGQCLSQLFGLGLWKSNSQLRPSKKEPPRVHFPCWTMTMRIQICHLNDQTFLEWTKKKSDDGCIALASSGTPSSESATVFGGGRPWAHVKEKDRDHQFVPSVQCLWLQGLMRCYLLLTRFKRRAVDESHHSQNVDS